MMFQNIKIQLFSALLLLILAIFFNSQIRVGFALSSDQQEPFVIAHNNGGNKSQTEIPDKSISLEDYLNSNFYEVSWCKAIESVSVSEDTITVYTTIENSPQNINSINQINNAIIGWIHENANPTLKFISIIGADSEVLNTVGI